MKKRTAALLLALLLLPMGAGAKSAIPKALRFTQKATARKIHETVTLRRTYPETAQKSVNREMRRVINDLAERNKKRLPKKDGYLDVGASILRTGPQYMSFLTVARTVQDKKQLYADCDARVYDMKTGERVTLDDLFDADSPAWPLLADAVRQQVTAYFSGTAPDPDKLNALCEKDALRSAGFTLSPARLSLHYRANEAYPGKKTLMHVHVYYPQIREYMTEHARKMTDAGRYKLIALTYDDGPARGLSMAVMNELRLAGASATFFLVGTAMRDNDDVVRREHDAGHTVASHNYYHVYEDITQANVKKWRTAQNKRMNALIGQKAALLRAPGGNARAFAAAKCGLPLIQWSAAAEDAPGGGKSADSIAERLRLQMRDGAVVLMHDLNPHVQSYTKEFLKALEKKNFLCVTVEELFSAYGAELKPNKIYKSCEKRAEKQAAELEKAP